MSPTRPPSPPMLLFGVARSDGKRSRAWRVVSVAAKPELYVVPIGLDRFVHASYHPAGKWHFKVDVNGEVHKSTIAASSVAPGFAHLFSIVFAGFSLYRTHVPEGVTWLAAPGEDRWMYVELVQESVGANRDSRPGKNTGAVLVGRLPIADDTTLAVVAHAEPATPITQRFNFPEDAAAVRARAVDRGDLRALILATTDTGVTRVIDGATITLFDAANPKTS